MDDAMPNRAPTQASRDGTAPGRSSHATRHDRRRLETRTRLIRALMKLLSRKSLADIAIHEITETADVGGGTFYNHFPDRAAIHDAMIAELVIGWSDVVGEIAPLRSDPAETMAQRVRIYVRRAGNDVDWARYVATNAFQQVAAGNPVGHRLAEVVEVGRRSGRFNLTDREVTLRAILGLVIATIHGTAGDPARAAVDATETARFVLRLLGVPTADTDRIVSQPLPAVPSDDGGLVHRAHAARLAAKA